MRRSVTTPTSVYVTRVGVMAALVAIALNPGVASSQVLGGRRGAAPESPLTIARLQYDPGDWYGNPTSIPNLLGFIREELGFDMAEREAVVRATDAELSRYPLLYLTGHGEIRLSDAEVEALRAYLESGGFLHADDNFGLDESMRKEIHRLFPNVPLVDLPIDHPIYRVAFALPGGLPKVHEHSGGPPRGYGVFHDGRMVVFYSFNTDLGDGWEDAEVHGDPEDVRRAALEMGANVFVYALTH